MEGYRLTPKKNISEEEIREVIDKYSSMIFRISYCILSNSEDAKDVVQETILKYITKKPDFNDENHQKAWLIKVATNISKNMLRFRIKNQSISLSDIENFGISENNLETFELIMSLPTKHKIVMSLYYVEGYHCKEIAELISINEEAVRKRLQKGRELLKKEIERMQLL